MKLHIPRTIEGATEELNGIGSLLTAKQWERAAIVYAFTRDGTRGPGASDETFSSESLSAAEFAALGVTGLKSNGTVLAYRKAWQGAIDDGRAVVVKPGDNIELPTLPWKDHFGEATPDVQARVFRQQLKTNPEAIGQAVRDEPSLAVKVARQVMQTPSIRLAIEAEQAGPIEARYLEPPPPRRTDYSEELTRGVNLLVPVLRAVQRGEWQPSAAETMLIHSLGLLLDQAARPEAVPADELFNDIARYLKEGIA